MKLKHFFGLILACFTTIAYAHHHTKTPTLIATYDSEPTAFVQGFEQLADGRLLMATGLYGQSTIGIFDLHTGRYTIKDTLPEQFFGEGVSSTPHGIWQLTWQENTAFLRDADTFAIKNIVHYQGEGWGLAYDDTKEILYMSDGTNTLQIRHPQTFKLLDILPIAFQADESTLINELEFADGFIYANIWQSNLIIKINPADGQIIERYDLSELIKTANITPQARQNMDVLNGIAHIKGKHFYLTGKFYPVIFEVELDWQYKKPPTFKQ